MRNPLRSSQVRSTRRASMTTVLAGASAMAMIVGLTLVSVGVATAASIAPHVTPAPCNVSVTGAGTAVPGQTLIVGVVAGTTIVTMNCDTASGAGVVAEASLLAAIGTSAVLQSTEADTSA